MAGTEISPEIRKQIMLFQRTEITEYNIYQRLARRMEGKNREVLERISLDEKRHAGVWRRYTGVDPGPDRLMMFFYLMLAFVFGITFAIKIMERNEESAEAAYGAVADLVPEARQIMHEEEEHEKALTDLLDEERLRYIGSMVLGLNDALVELTGALAGFTFALADGRVVGVAGLITGVAATLSMGASEFLSQRSESGELNPLKAAVYTGIAYLVTVTLLVSPFFIVANVYGAMLWALINALLVILFFSYFVSVVKETPFRPAFLEMAAISFGVALVSFLIGLLARRLLPIDI
ncbi:MAG: VIT1/CCC1 transporter family protein [Thermovirgaceae bacterium]|jgi:VIT1/CCC1 family predicted Fe2+/Mn2+ transporter|nr:VIT1/CCC1 transporter family protein [Synergistales bacterium]MDD4023906.1 VIT1/CCC1 transporter family protein [Synergistales bacterium]MDI9392349.1 VIT1/CCC1 transporter family protein [Synergistota bacterium]HOP51514.1 VIT1/CCC1 transporter family protein [Synergistales bacterium]